jgi:hypothetical protein
MGRSKQWLSGQPVNCEHSIDTRVSHRSARRSSPSPGSTALPNATLSRSMGSSGRRARMHVRGVGTKKQRHTGKSQSPAGPPPACLPLPAGRWRCASAAMTMQSTPPENSTATLAPEGTRSSSAGAGVGAGALSTRRRTASSSAARSSSALTPASGGGSAVSTGAPSSAVSGPSSWMGGGGPRWRGTLARGGHGWCRSWPRRLPAAASAPAPSPSCSWKSPDGGSSIHRQGCPAPCLHAGDTEATVSPARRRCTLNIAWQASEQNSRRCTNPSLQLNRLGARRTAGGAVTQQQGAAADPVVAEPERAARCLPEDAGPGALHACQAGHHGLQLSLCAGTKQCRHDCSRVVLLWLHLHTTTCTELAGQSPPNVGVGNK